MSAAGRALFRPELQTLHANGGVNTDLVDAASASPGKAVGLAIYSALVGVRFDLQDTMFFEPTAIKQSADRFRKRTPPVFSGRVSREKPSSTSHLATEIAPTPKTVRH
ncbi:MULTISPECIES: hypothetical protein [Rhizobium]|uniref:hypothetical protein n=1 Tax=Rhizobium TaxID=379 RepID=UPI001C90E788|nr:MULTISPECIES: hypothetical protein [Rhizobium]MBY3119999.1 hypothetical protein [Rhizobium laguerreae]MBY3157067.1 hypothetical protein [Rhizobium laguerreae]MBY3171464.1 hypothetical protein [Rhizobium laguerreae]MBY3193510.1 hypothetical protein [Rhizobium laguerreae]MBY3226646.1 hypothetical protein [Rhizobium laguerreae]